MIGSYQVKCLFTKGIEPFEAKGLFMSGNLENTISGGIDDRFARPHMFASQFLDDFRS